MSREWNEKSVKENVLGEVDGMKHKVDYAWRT